MPIVGNALERKKMNINPVSTINFTRSSNKIRPTIFRPVSNITPIKNVSFSGTCIKGMDLVTKSKFSPLEFARLQYKPKLPPVFAKGILALGVIAGAKTHAAGDDEE